MSDRRTVSRCLLVAAGLLTLTCAVFWRVQGFDFLDYDDGLNVTANPAVLAGLSAEGAVLAFRDSGSYRQPLALLSHMATVSVFGLAPGRHHLVNLLLHLANTLLLFHLLRRMTGRVWECGFAAALFAIHPLHVEPVAWVSGRTDLLYTFFGLLTLVAYASYCARPAFRRYLPVAAFFVLGLLSKPALVTLPFLMLLLDYWPLGRLGSDDGSPQDAPGRPSSASARRLIVEKAPLLACAAVAALSAYLIRERVYGTYFAAHPALGDIPLDARIANAFLSYASYASKTVWPASLAFLYPHPGAAYPVWRTAGSFLLVAGLTVLAIRQWRRRPWLTAGWLWYLGMLVPMIGLVYWGNPVAPVGMADRHTYFALVGLFVAAVWELSPGAGSSRIGRRGRLAVATAALVLPALAALSWIQAGYWKDSLAVYTRAYEVNPSSALMKSRAAALGRQGRYDDAIDIYRNVLRTEPGDQEAHYNLGVLLSAAGAADEAIRHFREAIRLDEDDWQARFLLGRALASRGLLDEAIVHYEKAAELAAGMAVVQEELGDAYFMRQRLGEAVERYRAALRILPDDAAVRRKLDVALGRGPRPDSPEGGGRAGERPRD